MRRSLVIASLSAVTAVASAHAQDTGGSVPDFDKKKGGSTKMHRLAHVPAHTGSWKAADVELEQDRNRPYAYLSGFVNYDVTIYDISNPSSPKQVYRWSIDNPELHRGIGAMDGKYFKVDGRYYFAQSLQFQKGTPDAEVGAVILDVKEALRGFRPR